MERLDREGRARRRRLVRGLGVVVAPVFAGGGMRIKVLEAMAQAKPVVATTIGAGGIEVENERDILIADDAVSFADAVIRLLRDSTFASKIGAAARDRRETLRQRHARA